MTKPLSAKPLHLQNSSKRCAAVISRAYLPCPRVTEGCSSRISATDRCGLEAWLSLSTRQTTLTSSKDSGLGLSPGRMPFGSSGFGVKACVTRHRKIKWMVRSPWLPSLLLRLFLRHRRISKGIPESLPLRWIGQGLHLQPTPTPHLEFKTRTTVQGFRT